MKIMLNSPQAKFSISIVHLFKSRQVNRSWDMIYQLKPSNFPCLLVLKSHGIHQRFKETIWAWAKVICKLYQGHAPVPSAYWSAHHPRPSLRLTSRKHQKARNQERGINLRSKKQHRWKPRTRGDKTRQEIRGHLTRWNHERSGECGAEFWSWRIFFFLKTRSWRIGYAGGSGIPVSARRWRRRRNGTGIGGCGEGFAGRRKKCVGPGAQQPTLRPILSSNWALPTDVLWKGPLAIPQEKEDQVQSTQFLAYTIILVRWKYFSLLYW